MIAMKKKTRKRELTGRDFDALSAYEKQRIIEEIESKTPQQHIAESRPLNRHESREWNKMKRQGKR